MYSFRCKECGNLVITRNYRRVNEGVCYICKNKKENDMNNEETINGVAIPTFEAAHRACADENCTAIQHLIYAYEPAGEEAGAFRWAVAEALREHEGEMLTLGVVVNKDSEARLLYSKVEPLLTEEELEALTDGDIMGFDKCYACPTCKYHMKYNMSGCPEGYPLCSIHTYFYKWESNEG